MSEINDLIERSSQIKSETTKGANTALRIGGLFYDIISSLSAISSDAHYDDSAIRAALNEVDTVLDSTIALVNNEQNRLDSVVNGISTTVNDKVNQVLNDSTWMEEHASWIHTTTPEGVTTWQEGWNENIEAYLQTAGVWSRNNNIDLTQWSTLTQSVDSFSSSLSSIQTDLNTKVNTTTFSALQQQVNTLSLTVETLSQADDSSISEALQTAINTSVNDAVNGENGAIAQLNLETTYAKKDAENVIAWMYSALKNQTTPTKTFNEIVSAGQSDLSSAVSEIRTCIETVNDQLVSEANFETKVNNTISGLYSQATAEAASTSIFSQLKQNTDDIATIVTSITGDSSSASMSTKFATWKSSLITTANKDTALAGLFATTDDITHALAGYVAEATFTSAKTQLEASIGNALTLATLETELDNAESSVITKIKNNLTGFVQKSDLESSTSALWSATLKSTISGIVADSTEMDDKLSTKANSDDLTSLTGTVNTHTTQISTLNTNVETANSNASSAVSTASTASSAVATLDETVRGLKSKMDGYPNTIAGLFTNTDFRQGVAGLLAEASDTNLFTQAGVITSATIDDAAASLVSKNNDFVAAIITKVNNAGSEIKLSADKIDLAGTTFINQLIADNAFISYLASGDANISGNITATSGYIGGWNIEENKLSSSNASFRISQDSTRYCYVGNNDADYSCLIEAHNWNNTCASFGVSGTTGSALLLSAGSYPSNTLSLESYGNTWFGLKAKQVCKFYDPKGDGKKIDSTGAVDFRVPITFNGMATCYAWKDVTLPSNPSNGMFVFCKECRVFPTNGHPIMEANGTSVTTAVGSWYGTNDKSTIFVYSEDAGKWIAFYCG